MNVEYTNPEYFLDMLKPLSSAKLEQSNITLYQTSDFKQSASSSSWVDNIKKSRWYGPFVKVMRSDKIYFFISHNGDENSESVILKICKNGAEIRVNFYDQAGGTLKNTVFYNI